MYLAVINPVSGNSQPKILREIFKKAFTETNQEIDFYETTGKEDIPAILKRLKTNSYKRVLVAGGDGTLSLVANVIHQYGSSISMSIVPVGTGNVIAKELGISTDWEAAIFQLAKNIGHTVNLDAMQINHLLYFSHVSMGTYSKIAEATTIQQKKQWGIGAYLKNAFQEFAKGERWRFLLTIDGRRYKIKSSLILIANVGAVGLADLNWGEQIVPTDGKLDVCIVRANTLKEYTQLIWATFRKKINTSPQIDYFRAVNQIEISTRSNLPVRADGEIIGNQKVVVKVLSNCIPVWVPNDKEI